MPNMQNITIKKFDGTTDIVWTGVQSGGSKERPAIWQSATVGNAVAHRPELRYYVERPSGNRLVETFTCQYPDLSTDSTTGITSIIGRQKIKVTIELDVGQNQTDLNEATIQFSNLFNGGLIKSVLPNGAVFT